MASNYYSKNVHPATAHYTGETIDAEHITTISAQVTWSALDKHDGSWQLQVSNDGASWVDKSTINVSTAAGTSEYSQPSTQRFVRVYVTNGTNTAGSYTITTMGKV
jgi:hypothetical protein